MKEAQQSSVDHWHAQKEKSSILSKCLEQDRENQWTNLPSHRGHWGICPCHLSPGLHDLAQPRLSLWSIGLQQHLVANPFSLYMAQHSFCKNKVKKVLAGAPVAGTALQKKRKKKMALVPMLGTAYWFLNIFWKKNFFKLHLTSMEIAKGGSKWRWNPMNSFKAGTLHTSWLTAGSPLSLYLLLCRESFPQEPMGGMHVSRPQDGLLPVTLQTDVNELFGA